MLKSAKELMTTAAEATLPRDLDVVEQAEVALAALKIDRSEKEQRLSGEPAKVGNAQLSGSGSC